MAADIVVKFCIGIALAYLIPRVPLWLNEVSAYWKTVSESRAGDRTHPQHHVDDDRLTVLQALGESWLPRKPSEMTLSRPVTFNPEGTGTEVIPFFLDHNDPIKQALNNRTLWGQGMENQWWEHPSAETVGDDIWRAVAWKIYKDHPLLDRAVGIEYWTNIGTATSQLDWHVDKDSDAWFHDGELIHPLWGAVYYGYPHSFRGGYLEVMVGGVYEEWPSHVGGEVERFRADYNRLVRFNASKWHRVSTITDDGERMALAVNLWDRTPRMFQSKSKQD